MRNACPGLKTFPLANDLQVTTIKRENMINDIQIHFYFCILGSLGPLSGKEAA